MIRSITVATLVLAAAAAVASGCNIVEGGPGHAEEQPLYRTATEGAPTSGERGNMKINEVNWAGSVDDEGNWDPGDVFIELQNKHPRPINVSRWHLQVEGDFEDSYRIPNVQEPIQPNGYFVIAAKPNGAFADEADVFIEDLRLGKKYLELELQGADRELMDGAGSTEERVFAGGYDGKTVRSMERVQLLFGDEGGLSANWHAFSGILRSDGTVVHDGLETVSEGYRDNTLATPGAANSRDYSGSTSAGGFE